MTAQANNETASQRAGREPRRRIMRALSPIVARDGVAVREVLQLDLLKSYVRLPDAQQMRVVEFAHSPIS